MTRANYTKGYHAPDGWIYVAGCDELPRTVKIGITREIQKRANALASQSIIPVQIRWKVWNEAGVEEDLHKRFDQYRTHGEWFTFPDGVDPVSTIVAAYKEREPYWVEVGTERIKAMIAASGPAAVAWTRRGWLSWAEPGSPVEQAALERARAGLDEYIEALEEAARARDTERARSR